MLKSDRRGILIFLAVLLLAAAAALFAAPAPALADSGDPLVDKYIPFDVRTTLIKGIPLYGKGKLHLYMDYSTETKGAVLTQHNLRIYAELDFDKVGLSAAKETDADISIPLVKDPSGKVSLVRLRIAMTKFVGDLNWKGVYHWGKVYHWYTTPFFPLVFAGGYVEDDPVQPVKLDFNEMNATGKLRAALSVGPEISGNTFIGSISVNISAEAAIDFLGTKTTKYRISNDDQGSAWHVCDECEHVQVWPVIGPIRITSKMSFDKKPRTIVESSQKKLDKTIDYWYSKTFDEVMHHECTHYGYRLDVKVVDPDEKPLQGVKVRYENPPAHYEPKASGVTGADGTVTLYPPADDIIVVDAEITSPHTHETIEGKVKQFKTESAEEITMMLDIPSKHVRFMERSDDTESEKWPEDITFYPFFSPKVMLPNVVPVRSGWQFKGWATEDASEWYMPGETLELTEDLTLYAEWTKPETHWLVMFVANGGTGAPDPILGLKEYDIGVPDTIPRLGDLTFLGWATDPDSTYAKYKPKDLIEYTPGRDYLILYALWDTPRIRITFDANGAANASVPPGPIVLTEPCTINVGRAIAPGLTFLGWSEDWNAKEQQYWPGQSCRFDKSTTLYAVWRNDNGGTSLDFMDSMPETAATGMPDEIIIYPSENMNVQLPDETPEKNGWIFTGWNTAKDGSGSSYGPGENLLLSGDMILWAQWEPDDSFWYVVYNANGGTGAPASQKVPEGQNAVVSEQLPAGKGLTFKGWTPDPQSPKTVYQPGDILPFDGLVDQLILYALWEADDSVVEISFDNNLLPTDDIPDDIRLGSGGWVRLEPIDLPSDSPYIFLGWSEDPAAEIPEYRAGRTYYFDASAMLYAIWDAEDAVTLSFMDSQPDKVTGMPQKVVIFPVDTREARIPDDVPEKTGMFFTGWNLSADGSGESYGPGEMITLAQDTTLWAQWENAESNWIVLYNANGGTDAPDTQVIPREQNAVVSTQQPRSSNMGFLGWSTNPRAVTPGYQPGDPLPYDSDNDVVVLYAVWKADERIVFDANGVEEAVLPADILLDKPGWVQLQGVNIPEGCPYGFLGWSENPDADDPEYLEDITYYFSSGVRLYAVWENRGTWTVTYDANGGTSAPDAQVFPVNRPAVLSSELPVHEYDSMVFLGWSEGGGGMMPLYQPGGQVPYKSGRDELVLYATWAADRTDLVLVTFDANGGPPEGVPSPLYVNKSTGFYLAQLPAIWDGQHDFLGWARDPDAYEPDWKEDDLADFDADTTVYAVWKPHYTVIEGAGAVWMKGSGKTRRFVADGDLKYFRELRIDGLPFNEGVQISSGSTVAEISAKAMEKLSVGKHTVTFLYADGEASAPFTVSKPVPKTGDGGNPALWLSLMAIGFILLGGTVILWNRKKRCGKQH